MDVMTSKRFDVDLVLFLRVLTFLSEGLARVASSTQKLHRGAEFLIAPLVPVTKR
ncbi:hypothetical protein [Streptomyces sp. 351MFTsu5.1]|uniref:hypothetical protein n=1 Tax=Streptomyces sp. 351MFTsu5.1 TaxID=1172180 RepID=UPI001319EB72|nr:hypothetical protein [Streptomyces sp. 351MFTsu5.1]